MRNALRKSAVVYFFGESRIKSRVHKLTITAFYLFQPNSALQFETIRAEIQSSSLPAEEKKELLEKFAKVGEEWKKIVLETIKSIDESLSDSGTSQSNPQIELVAQTKTLVIGGRTFASKSPVGRPLGIEDELARYSAFTFAEFVKCKFIFFKAFN